MKIFIARRMENIKKYWAETRRLEAHELRVNIGTQRIKAEYRALQQS